MWGEGKGGGGEGREMKGRTGKIATTSGEMCGKVARKDLGKIVEIAGKRRMKELGNAREREKKRQKKRKITEKGRKGEKGGKEWKLTKRKWWGKDRKMHQKRGNGRVYGREIAGEWEKACLKAGKGGRRMGKGWGKSRERTDEEGGNSK